MTTANPSYGAVPPSLPESPFELQRYIDNELAIRFGSALFSKLKRRYWELPQVAGKPLVFAIQNFASKDSLQFSDTALAHYLYGFRTYSERSPDGHLLAYTADVEAIQREDGRCIPSNFFATPDAEHVSAVLWTNSGTVNKFGRIGFQRRLDSEGIHMRRIGVRFDSGPDVDVPEPFDYAVGDRWESWEEGLVMAHNPHAVFPLPDDAFPGIVHQMITPQGEFRALYPPFHAISSRTVILVETAGLSGN